MLNKFCDFLEKRNNISTEKLDTKKWKIIEKCTYPGQTDSTNCGIYILYYCLCIMKVFKASKSFDPMKFRRTLALELLEMSPTLKHLCLKCGRSEFENIKDGLVGEMVQCAPCHRWLHKKCDQVLRDIEMDEIQKETFTFRCALCRRASETDRKIKQKTRCAQSQKRN